MIVRKAETLEDWQKIREICCLTGNNGEPIREEQWPFFSEQWVSPYEKLESDWAYVLVEGTQVLGYLLGCPDTKKHLKKKWLTHHPALFGKILFHRYGYGPNVRRHVKRELRLTASPEAKFGSSFLKVLRKDYPAHLHTNLIKSARGKGGGNLLMQTFLNDLKSQGLAGVHLFCGVDPLKFYFKNGFHESRAIDFTAKMKVHCLVQKIL